MSLLNVPINFINPDIPSPMRFDYNPDQLRKMGYEHVYILTDLPQMVPEQMATATDGVINDLTQFSRGG